MLVIMPKARISITIDSKTAHDIENYYRSRVKIGLLKTKILFLNYLTSTKKSSHWVGNPQRRI